MTLTFLQVITTEFWQLLRWREVEPRFYSTDGGRFTHLTRPSYVLAKACKASKNASIWMDGKQHVKRHSRHPRVYNPCLIAAFMTWRNDANLGMGLFLRGDRYRQLECTVYTKHPCNPIYSVHSITTTKNNNHKLLHAMRCEMDSANPWMGTSYPQPLTFQTHTHNNGLFQGMQIHFLLCCPD